MSDLKYQAHADRQQRAAHVAMAGFLDVLPEANRRLLLNLDVIKSELVREVLLRGRGDMLVRALEKMPPDRLRRLFEVEPKSSGDVGLEGDVAESPSASYHTDLSAEIDDLADELQEQFRMEVAAANGVALFAGDYLQRMSESYNAWLLSKVIIRLTMVDNCKIAAVAMAFAVGVPRVFVPWGAEAKRKYGAVDGRHPVDNLHSSQLSAARALGTSRSNLCKATCGAAEYLAIEEGIHLKHPSAKRAFSLAGSNNHWRGRKWEGLGDGN